MRRRAKKEPDAPCPPGSNPLIAVTLWHRRGEMQGNPQYAAANPEEISRDIRENNEDE